MQMYMREVEIQIWNGLLALKVVCIQTQQASNTLRPEIWNTGQNLLILFHISVPVIVSIGRIKAASHFLAAHRGSAPG